MSGNDQIGLYAYMPALKFARFYPLNDQILTGIAQRGLVDETLKWETVVNFGLDAGFLKNKLTVTLDYFRDDRTDILRSLEGLPDFPGMPDKPVMNLMSIRNKGWELSAGYNN